MQNRKPKLPEDVLESIFSYVQPHRILQDRALSDARSILTLSDIPAAAKAIEQVIELDTTAPIPQVQACSGALLKPHEVEYIVFKAKSLRKIRVTHIPGSCFVPLLRCVVEIEFLDAEDVDITPIARRVTRVNIHKPTKKTLNTLTERGRCMEDVTFTAVEGSLIDEVIKVLDKWRNRITKIGVFVKEPFSSCQPNLPDQALRKLTSHLSLKGPTYFTSLKVLKIGRYDDINLEIDAGLRNKIKDCNEFWDTEFLSFLPPFSPSDESVAQVPRKNTAFKMQGASDQTVPEKYSRVQELCLLDIEHADQNRRSYGSYRRIITRFAREMKELTHLSIRLQVVLKEGAIDCVVFNFIRFFLETGTGINLLEVTKDFILLPMMARELANLLNMDNLSSLVVTSTPRRINYFRQVHVEHTRNKSVAKAIPEFLAFVNEHCPTMERVFLSDCGAMEVTNRSEPAIRSDLILATKAIEDFEKDNSRVDISTMKAQVGIWLHSLKSMANNPRVSLKAC